MCLITQGKKISVMEDLIKLYLQAFLYLSERLISSSLPCHPISVHWMKVQRSHRCQTIPQRSPKWNGKLHLSCAWCNGRGELCHFSVCEDWRPHLGNWSVEQVNMFLFVIRKDITLVSPQTWFTLCHATMPCQSPVHGQTLTSTRDPFPLPKCSSSEWKTENSTFPSVQGDKNTLQGLYYLPLHHHLAR